MESEMILFAVNGTLMRGLELNKNLIEVGAKFIREDQTAPTYRLWSINDNYPAMQMDKNKGESIHIEIWEITMKGLMTVLENEPPGLCLGTIVLRDNSIVFGILGEAYACEGNLEITSYHGWRKYIAH